MPFQVSPGVNVSEIDLTTTAPAVSTSDGAMVGQFAWGPANEATNVSSETQLVSLFGKPNNDNYKSWFTASNYLSYISSLKVVRTLGTGAANAVTGTPTETTPLDASENFTGVGITAADFSGFAQVVQNFSGDASATSFTITSPALMTDRTATVVVDGQTLTVGTNFTITGQVIDFTGGSAPHGAPSSATDNIVVTTAARTKFTLSRDSFGETPTITGTSETFTTSGSVVTFATAPAAGTNNINISIPARTKFTLAENVDSTDSVTVLVDTVSQTEGSAWSRSGQVVTFATAPANSAAIIIKVFSATATAPVYDSTAIKIENASTDRSTLGGTNNRFAARWAGTRGNNLTVYVADEATFTNLPSVYQGLFTAAPAAGSNELHVVVTEKIHNGISMVETVVETWAFLSKASNGKMEDGTNNYYMDYINENSDWIWCLKHPAAGTDWGVESTVSKTTFANMTTAYVSAMTKGSAGTTPTLAEVMLSYDLLLDPETIDVSLLMMGEWGELSGNASDRAAIIQKLIDIAESRKDCVALISPTYASVNNASASEVVSSFSSKTSNYAFADSNWKKQYDKYNDVYRWVPLNGDTAGLMARTDSERDSWFSPAGFNRGVLKNVVSLAWPQNKADRDVLYKSAINPVCTFPGQGTVLFGDKTLTVKPSAFDRINVRRLFITLEKSIASASKFTLFEFNDEFTRAQFVSLVEPFLRDVKGRRGIYDFKVVCDETNNTSGVIDRNEFVGDIFIKPARSVNFIQLNFVAVRTGVSFEEVVGAV